MSELLLAAICALNLNPVAATLEKYSPAHDYVEISDSRQEWQLVKYCANGVVIYQGAGYRPNSN